MVVFFKSLKLILYRELLYFYLLSMKATNTASISPPNNEKKVNWHSYCFA